MEKEIIFAHQDKRFLKALANMLNADLPREHEAEVVKTTENVYSLIGDQVTRNALEKEFISIIEDYTAIK